LYIYRGNSEEVKCTLYPATSEVFGNNERITADIKVGQY